MTPQLKQFLTHWEVRLIDGKEVESTKNFYSYAKRAIKLPSLIEFISSLHSCISWISFENENADPKHESLSLIFAYKDFISQQLALSMFVPCKDGKVLEEPKVDTTICCDAVLLNNNWCPSCDRPTKGRYAESLEQVIFEGWEVVDDFNGLIYLDNSQGNLNLCFDPKTGQPVEAETDSKTISDIIRFGVYLKTP